jgi:alcohol dehydrogenase class IV
MCLGALFSGLAFSNTRTTACHGLSYPLTAHFGIEHGFAVCMTLPAVMRINWPMVQEQDLLLAAWGADSVDAVSTWLDQVSDPVQPLRLASFGVSAQDATKVFESDSLVKERMGNNPAYINLNQIINIMIEIE